MQEVEFLATEVMQIVYWDVAPFSLVSTHKTHHITSLNTAVFMFFLKSNTDKGLGYCISADAKSKSYEEDHSRIKKEC